MPCEIRPATGLFGGKEEGREGGWHPWHIMQRAAATGRRRRSAKGYISGLPRRAMLRAALSTFPVTSKTHQRSSAVNDRVTGGSQQGWASLGAEHASATAEQTRGRARLRAASSRMFARSHFTRGQQPCCHPEIYANAKSRAAPRQGCCTSNEMPMAARRQRAPPPPPASHATMCPCFPPIRAHNIAPAQWQRMKPAQGTSTPRFSNEEGMRAAGQGTVDGQAPERQRCPGWTDLNPSGAPAGQRGRSPRSTK